MSIWVMLSNLVIGPLKLLFEVIFALSNRVLNEGLSIIVLSLAVNFLVLPLYRRADALQEEERQTETRLAPMVGHIKNVFRGDEQMMILQTYYRQNHYSPMHALKGAVPLLLQIPFFIAAYQFLSRLGCLQGTAFGPIQDLSQPDQLLWMGGITLNLLPILMTIINLLSGALYMRGAPLKNKIQLWAMALVFLVLLYGSPAGLTFYWTLNNLFSLGKNILQKLLPAREKRKREAPALLRGRSHPGLFFLCGAALVFLTGLLIPSAVIVSSPQDFMTYYGDPNPLWYVVNALLLAAGTFLLWFGVFYALGSPAMRKGMEYTAWALTGIFLVNYLFFRNNLGTISNMLRYDDPPMFTLAQKLVNLGILALVALVFTFLLAKRETLVRGIAWTMVLVMGVMAGRNLWITEKMVVQIFEAKERNYSGAQEIPLSQDGKNVVVLMLDRAISSYLPCILYERPELREVYSGFTYYPNTLSFGAHTKFGAPAIFGGYDYAPRVINARDTVSLKDKQNEALLLMPTIFSEQGYRISIFDVPYPGNYLEGADYSIFDSLPNTNARILSGTVTSDTQWEKAENFRLRNFFCYSLSMVVPTVLYGPIYNSGYYNRAKGSASLFSMNGEAPAAVFDDLNYTKIAFIAEYDVLCSLSDMTSVLQEDVNTLLVMGNGTPHSQVLLPEPEYAPVRVAENEKYDAEHADRFLAGPFPLRVTEETHMEHYDVNMAALLKVGEWLEYLKEVGVYNNTRIIIVADHGDFLGQIEEGMLDTGVSDAGYNSSTTFEDVMSYNPLLLVKDFNASGEIQTDTTFMTNGDVPTIAMEGLISDPVNPFTGNAVTDREKQDTCYVSTSHLFGLGSDRGTTFEPDYWFEVSPGNDTLYDSFRWTFIPEKQ